VVLIFALAVDDHAWEPWDAVPCEYVPLEFEILAVCDVVGDDEEA
jgi:hypothetical protein